MNKTYIKLYRQIRDNWIWKQSEPFDKRSAWIDLLLSANRFEKTVHEGGQDVVVKPGQFLLSIEKLCERWQWSRNKVKRFLANLQSEQMLDTIRTHKWTIFEITNFALYQGFSEDASKVDEPTSEPTSEPTDEPTGEPQTRKTKKDKYIYIESNDSIRQTDAVRRVLEKWNAQSEGSGIPSVSRLTSGSKRYAMLFARIKEYGIENVELAISKIGESPFLRGQTRHGFMITFDWFVRPNNFVKVLEGNYSLDKNGAQQQRGVDTW